MLIRSSLRAFQSAPLTFKIAVAWLLLLVVAIVLEPVITGWAYDEIDWSSLNSPPSAIHWFGTDGAGRDLLTRTLVGGRISLTIALLATLVSFSIGIIIGGACGYLGGWVDQILMRIVDGLYAVPFVLVVILLVVLFGRSIYLLFLGLGALSWLDIARISRGQAMVVNQQSYVLSAKAMGLSEAQILLRHVIPNILNPAIVYATLTVPGVIIAESFISYLGLGVQEPLTSWGVLISIGTKNIHSSPWQLTFPALVLAGTLLALYVISDHLQQRLTTAHR